MLSKNPKKRPTICIIEEHLLRWGASDSSSVNVFDFFSGLFTLISQNRHIVPVQQHAIVKRKEDVPKIRPRTWSKDHHMLQ